MFDINKPCIQKCCLDEDDVCVGCFRTLEQMREWYKLTDNEKYIILKNANQNKVNKYKTLK